MPPRTVVLPGPPPPGEDPELDRVTAWFEAQGDLEARFGAALRRALDEVIDTARTKRWDLEQCGDQEKGYVGVKTEHVVRGEFDLPYGVSMDFDVDGVDVDCKYTKNEGQWQIPPEAVGHICLLLWADDPTSTMNVGLLRIREDELVGGNRDAKRTVQSPAGRSRVRWLVPTGQVLPENFLLHMPTEDRDAILALRGGDARAKELFIRCEGIIIKRHTIESIGQQLDEARRFRGETRDALRVEGFEVLNGHWLRDRARAEELGGPVPRNSREWICLRSDGSTPQRLAARLAHAQAGTIEAAGRLL